MNRHITRESEMIRQARYNMGFSQQQVATMVGMQVRQYQRLEYGESDIRRIGILFVLAMVAEEESHMKSEAMLLSLEWRFSRGRFMTPALLGYDRVEVPDGNGGHRKILQINPDEAETVRLMYYLLLNGRSTQEIAETLTDLGRILSQEWADSGGRERACRSHPCADHRTSLPALRQAGHPVPRAEREEVLLGHLQEPLVEQPYGPCQPESHL